MDIHIVIEGDTVETIATKYSVSAERILMDNNLRKQDKLVLGQALVILHPKKTYTVREGDTLIGIAAEHGITLTQLFRNNIFLTQRKYIYPGDILVISYNNNRGKVTVGGFAYPHISKKNLIKSLPFLTHLSIFNYTMDGDGELTTYYDDTEIIRITKEYGVAPLLLITTLTVRGEPNIQAAYDILANEEIQDTYIRLIFDLVQTKGYYGVNLSFQYYNPLSQELYIKLFNKIRTIGNTFHIPIYVTINPNKSFVGNQIVWEEADYTVFNQLTTGATFMSFNWGFNFGPPVPIASIEDFKRLIELVSYYLPPDKISIGIPMYGYNWELPYNVGFSSATFIRIDSIQRLAEEVGAVIQFDAISQTPYFTYTDASTGIHHLVWFIDARTVNSLMSLVEENKLQGTGVWNIMQYYAMVWSVINSQYEINRIEDL